MSREFMTQVIGRAIHEEGFRRLLQHDAQTATDAMGLTYTPDDLRAVQALSTSITALSSDAAREFLQGLAEQPQDIFGSPQRPS